MKPDWENLIGRQTESNVDAKLPMVYSHVCVWIWDYIVVVVPLQWARLSPSHSRWPHTPLSLRWVSLVPARPKSRCPCSASPSALHSLLKSKNTSDETRAASDDAPHMWRVRVIWLMRTLARCFPRVITALSYCSTCANRTMCDFLPGGSCGFKACVRHSVAISRACDMWGS